MNLHLDPEQFYNLLNRHSARPSSALFQAEQHLLACPECRVQLESVRESLGNFRVAATQLSLAEAPTRLLDPRHPRARLFTLPRAAWASGLVAAMALGTVSLSILHKPAAAPSPAIQTSTVAPQTVAQSGAQSDDALLNGIDTDLSTSVPPSLQPLDATSAPEKSTSSSNN